VDIFDELAISVYSLSLSFFFVLYVSCCNLDSSVSLLSVSCFYH